MIVVPGRRNSDGISAPPCAYVAPATVAGYSATYGIAHMAMPSPIWQTIFAIVGAIAISVTAFVRFTAMAPPRTAEQGMMRG